MPWSAMHASFDPDDHDGCNAAVLCMHCTESNGEISSKNDLPRAFSYPGQTELFFFFPFPVADPYHRTGNGGGAAAFPIRPSRS
jgi:hypothetical protein